MHDQLRKRLLLSYCGMTLLFGVVSRVLGLDTLAVACGVSGLVLFALWVIEITVDGD